jgi:Na+-driven multidrug efflux pump
MACVPYVAGARIDADDHHGPPAPTLRRIAALALPALVVLAVEPLYVLVDTARGRPPRAGCPLAALAIGGSVLPSRPGSAPCFSYGTTARAARRFGAGQRAPRSRRASRGRGWRSPPASRSRWRRSSAPVR